MTTKFVNGSKVETAHELTTDARRRLGTELKDAIRRCPVCEVKRYRLDRSLDALAVRLRNLDAGAEMAGEYEVVRVEDSLEDELDQAFHQATVRSLLRLVAVEDSSRLPWGVEMLAGGGK